MQDVSSLTKDFLSRVFINNDSSCILFMIIYLIYPSGPALFLFLSLYLAKIAKLDGSNADLLLARGLISTIPGTDFTSSLAGSTNLHDQSGLDIIAFERLNCLRFKYFLLYDNFH